MPTIINGDGVVTAGGTASTQGKVVLGEQTGNGTNTVTIQAPATLAADLTFTMPTADGTNGQVLQTNGSGALSFVNQTAPTSLATPLAVIGDATAGAEIRLPEDTDNGSNYVALKAADSLASNLTFTLPSADGSNGQLLQTNGSGTLSFTTVSTGVTEVGSVARQVYAQNIYMMTPSATTGNGGGKMINKFVFGSSSANPAMTCPLYSTYYGVWYTNISGFLALSQDGLNYTLVDSFASSMQSLNVNSGTVLCPFVIDDSNGKVFAFGLGGGGYIGYCVKSSISGSWGGFNIINTSGQTIWAVEYVDFGTAANSGIVICWSDSSNHYLSTIPAGSTTSTSRASTSNNNGQAMIFEWNKTANRAFSVQRTPSSGQAAIFLSPSGNINASWSNVTNTTAGFSPGNNISQTRPVLSNAGYGLIWEDGNSTYRYTTTTTLSGAWTSGSTPDGNQILYLGHNGTVWYMATGATGTAGTSGLIYNFYTTSSVTPTGWATAAALPILGLGSSSAPYSVTTIPYYSQRKY